LAGPPGTTESTTSIPVSSTEESCLTNCSVSRQSPKRRVSSNTLSRRVI
jgi:hypothetical protein